MRKMEQKNRILIVEDDTDINNLLYTALQKAGYETVQAFSGTEARMLFQMDKAGFSLILLDLMLPGISGEEVLAQIRKQGNTPVIVLTAKDGLDAVSYTHLDVYKRQFKSGRMVLCSFLEARRSGGATVWYSFFR